MNTINKPLIFALTAISLSMSGAVLAQSTPPAPPPPAMHDKDDMDHAKWAEKMQERMLRHQVELHDKLKLTTAQEPAWKTFIEAVKAPPGAQPMRADPKEMDKLSTPERMEKMLGMMKDRQAKAEAHLAALKTFYGVLTAEQKKTFDDSHRHMQHRMGDEMERGMPRPKGHDGKPEQPGMDKK
ncbi:Spy/CpxP family protein refolding chaperone [Undibacterium sp. Jales W-56]|uniref:Spy/CpxP family protein refolding chaperone n=1 Tax=Undibacterium sp. Jales W-56 TaxID=2897325 RepID=UPI0021D0A9AA|nr:Spy/CpxP family protein refolding chaperone [Undibacterium sp. Jales W-56]MCU6434237.1 Spy/CpxP family protein refolding chaperone [Undibacterium sp. Jales W-56]